MAAAAPPLSEELRARRAAVSQWSPELGVTHEALYRCVAALVRRGLLRRSPERLQLQRSRA
jgi:DNA-binding IclR family transcriptional regulator